MIVETYMRPSSYGFRQIFSALLITLAFHLSFALGQLSAQTKLPTAAANDWIRLNNDLEALFPAQPTTLLGSDSVLLRTSLQRFRLGVIRASEYGKDRLRVQELCRQSGALVCINANFYDEFGRPLGLVVSRGVVHSPLHRGGSLLTGVFEAGRNRLRIVSRLEYDPSQALEAVQAGPRLLLKGVALRGIRDTSRSNRSALCLDELGRLIFFVYQSGLGGISLADTQDLLLSKAVGCYDALNLDGGGSAQLFVSPQLVDRKDQQIGGKSLSIQGFDEVPVALGLFERLQPDA